MTTTKFEIDKFIGTNDFSLWRIKMRAFLVHQGLDNTLSKETMDAKTNRVKDREVESKAHSAILLSLGHEVLREVEGESTRARLWSKLEALYMKKSVANR
ncbi:hypothetical protein PanWU01x14_218530, partial [Parasponia andersonii]